MGALLVFFAVEILAFYLVFVGGTWPGLYTWEIRAASVALAAGVAIAWAVAAWRDPRWRPRSVLMPVLGLALASMAVSTAVSRYPRQSLEYLGYAALCVGGYLLLVRLLADDGLGRRVRALVIVLALAIPGLYAALSLLHWAEFWSLVGRVVVPPLRPSSEGLTFGNPSAALTAALLSAAGALASIRGRGAGARVYAGLVLAGVAFTTLVSGSRGGWFGLGVAVVAMAAMWLAPAANRGALRAAAGRLSGRARVAAAGAGVVAVGIGVALAPSILRRLTDGGQDLRINYFKAALRMFEEAPILGTGPGTWVIQRVASTAADETDYYIPHAHDVYVQTLAELGIAGAVVGLIAIAAVAWLVRDGIRDADPGRRRWAWAAAFSLLYLAGHQVLDFYMNFPAILFLAAVPVAVLDATGVRAPAPAGGRWFVRLPDRLLPVSLAVVLAVCAGLGWSESVASRQQAGVVAANEGDWATAGPLLREAAQADPAWSVYLFDAGLAAAHAGDHAAAVSYLERAAALEPAPVTLVNLAAERLLLGDTAGATSAVTEAARLGLQRQGTAMGIGVVAGRLGLTELSTRAFAAAIAADFTLAGDPWWRSADRPGAPFAEIVAAAEAAAAPSSRWAIAVVAGDPVAARAYADADATATGSAVTARQVVEALLGDAAAASAVAAAAAARPLDLFAVAWAQRLAYLRGDAAEGRRLGGWAQIASSGAGISPLDRRVVPSDTWVFRGFESTPIFWGTYTYRRQTPFDMLVPSLPHIEPVEPSPSPAAP